MKIGMLARCEDRGLGNMTWEWYRHVQPDRTLLVDLGALARNFPQHPERFPDSVLGEWNSAGQFDEQIVRRWLDGLDVVYTAETFYDWRIVEWARELGVRTVCHLMPEFYRHGSDATMPTPDVWWLPTTWRASYCDLSSRIVPVPVPTDRFELTGRLSDTLRLLHVIGHRAAADRNGTRALLQALRRVREPMRVTMVTQDERMPIVKLPSHVELITSRGGVDDYWQLYADHDVLVLPRRYGGLSLPVLEAAGAGLGVVMTHAQPQATDWPFVRLVSSHERPGVETPAGLIPTVDADPYSLSAELDRLARDRTAVLALQHDALAWARANSWDVLLPAVLDELAAACR